jgi:N-methylhydantoinase A
MRIGIDIGGTFTDFVLFDESSGEFVTHKILSTPDDPAQAVLDGLDHLELLSSNGPTGSRLAIVHGSTVATNALLERKGARTALVTTAGFRDVLAIGRQVRSHLYDFYADRPEPLVPDLLRLEVDERVDHSGQVLKSLNNEDLLALVEQLHRLQVESVAVCLLFSFVHADHERRIGSALRQAGFSVSLSHEILPEFREYERTSTTVINAYVSPVLDRYIGRLASQLQDVDLRIMQSNGGSISARRARQEAVRSILSGPAGGVVGAQHVAQAAGFAQAITFDMGGTSTDVSLCDAQIHVTSEAEIGGLPVRVPVIDIHTVGAGGGSIAYMDLGGALRVGPQSAGADPGPVCYRRGGHRPTVTDANLVLGRLIPERFLDGRLPLDASAAQQSLTQLAEEAGLVAEQGLSPAQRAALGVIHVANAHMERALRVISVERGFDPEDFTLVSFGGAGGLHACDLARALGMRRVLVPQGASTLSAFGMLVADVVKDYVKTVMLPGDVTHEHLEALLAPLAARGQMAVAGEGIPASGITLYRELDMRYVGQSYELRVPLSVDFISAFHRAHQKIYGHNEPTAPLEIVNLRLRAVGSTSRPAMPTLPRANGEIGDALIEQRPLILASGRHLVPIYDGQKLLAGHVIGGPALVVQPDTTVFVAPGDLAQVDQQGNLVIDIRP